MYNYFISKHFKRQIKHYSKKFPNIIPDVINTLRSFDPNLHIHLGENTYKIRLKSSDLSKGSSKSFRLIILLVKMDNLITPLVLYYKGEQQSIRRKDIQYHAMYIKQELDNTQI